MLREDFWQPWQVLEGIANDKEKKAPWGIRGGRSMQSVPLVKWTEEGHGLSCTSYWLLWDVLVLRMRFPGVLLRSGEGRMQDTRVFHPRDQLSLSSAPPGGLQPRFRAWCFVLHSLATQRSESSSAALQTFCSGLCYKFFWWIQTCVCVYVFLHMKNGWEWTKPSCIDLQFPWSEGCWQALSQ